jgi:hypothetical protein
MNGTQAYVLSRGASVAYVDKVLEGVTLIEGKNCTIDAITPSADGKYTTVTFGWTGNSGTHYTSEMRVDNGKDGRSIQDVNIAADAQNKLHLYVTLDDGTVQDAGLIPLPTVEVGDTETVEYDEPAEVIEVTTVTGIKLNFKIPRGEPGGSDPIWHIV